MPGLGIGNSHIFARAGAVSTLALSLFGNGEYGDTWDATDTSTLNSGSISSGNGVTVWTGLAGNLSFGTSSSAPVWNVSSGQASVDLNGVDQDLEAAISISAFPFVLAGVAIPPSGGNSLFTVYQGATQYAGVVGNPGPSFRGAQYRNAALVTSGQPLPASGAFQYFEAEFVSTTLIRMRVGDGTPTTGVISDTAISATKLLLGSTRDTSLFATGKVVHLLFRNQLFTDDERALYKAEALSKLV